MIYASNERFRDAGGQVGMEFGKRSAVTVVVAVAALTFTSTFVSAAVYYSGWRAEELGWTTVEDGFYDFAWNSRGELQLAYIGTAGPWYALIYGERVDGIWTLTPVAQLAYEYEGAYIAIDSSDKVHICTWSYRYVEWMYPSANVLYATNADGTWQTQFLNVSYYCTSAALAVDGEDNVHVLYSRSSYSSDHNGNSSIVDLVKTPQGWNKTVLKLSQGVGNQLLIEDVSVRPDGTIGMIYTQTNGTSMWDSQSTGYLNYSAISGLHLENQETVISSLDYLWFESSLCHDAAGRAYVAAFRERAGESILCCYTNKGGDWSFEEVAYGGGGQYYRQGGNAIAVDSNGAIHMAYMQDYHEQGLSNHSARYCTNAGGTWKTKVLDVSPGWDTDTIDVTTDSDLKVHVVLFQRTVGDEGEHDVSIYMTNSAKPRMIYAAASVSTLVALPFTALAGISVGGILLSERLRTKRWRTAEELQLYDEFVDRRR